MAAPARGEMAVETGDLRFAGVQFVREGQRLLRREAAVHADARDRRHTERPDGDNGDRRDQECEARASDRQ